jgi:hypothetical protein
MIAGKENLVFFETLAKRQERIYPDACDYGVVVFNGKITEEGMNLKSAILDNTHALIQIYKHRKDVWDDIGGKGACIEMDIPYEKENDIYVGVRMRLSYYINKKQKKQFISIDFFRYESEISPFKEVLSECCGSRIIFNYATGDHVCSVCRDMVD